MPEIEGGSPRERVIAADDLLRRLSEWDALNSAPYAGDRDYWLGEIARVRALLSDVTEGGEDGGT